MSKKEENFAENLVQEVQESKPSVGQEQIHSLLFNREIGWQEIIYDLINTEQLNPWDINLTILSDKYLEKVRALEEADFFVSSKVLLAASLLLRIKTEFLLNRYIKSIDEILFGNKEEKQVKKLERIELEDEIPELIPKSPIPRYKKVTLQELISALNKAITTENRRIKKEIVNKNALRETGISLPKRKATSIKDKIKEVLSKLTNHFEENTSSKNIKFSQFAGEDKEERILTFYPLLHLENQQKVWLHQEIHFEDIDIWLKKIYLKHNPDPLDELKKELELELESLSSKEKKRLNKINKDFENPLGEEAF